MLMLMAGVDSTDDDGNEQTRELGLVVARGPMLTLISPLDGSEQIANPFLQEATDSGGGATMLS